MSSINDIFRWTLCFGIGLIITVDMDDIINDDNPFKMLISSTYVDFNH